MTLKEAMAALEDAGSEKTRKTYLRHGAQEPLFGVSSAAIGALKKQIKKDHPLALELWETGNFDARYLATTIADPAIMRVADLERWALSIDTQILADLVGRYVASKSETLRKVAATWRLSTDDFLAQTGWVTLAVAAMEDPQLTDADLRVRLQEIETRMPVAGNRTRHAMNQALIAIGLRNTELQKAALGAAGRIGKVVVDHGDTDCKTPDAAAYILKASDRKKSARA